MKKLLLVLVVPLVLCGGIWAAGEKEAAAPKMEKIVFLTTEYHDNPELHDVWEAEFKRLTGVEMELKFDSYFSKNQDYIVVDEPSAVVPAFDTIYSDMKDKKNQLFWKYVLGEHSFDDMMKQFEAYKKEIDFDSILTQINEGL
jgi:hypothetical protein